MDVVNSEAEEPVPDVREDLARMTVAELGAQAAEAARNASIEAEGEARQRRYAAQRAALRAEILERYKAPPEGGE